MTSQNKRKSPNGTGSVYKTKSGQWKAALTIPALNGTSKRITRNATSQRHGVLLLDELRAETRSLSDNPESVSVTELADKWLISFEGEASTLDGYQGLLNHHISPHIGERLISSLKPLDVQEWVQALRAVPTGATTVQKAYTLLNRICTWAVTIRRLTHNPCDGIKRPTAKRKAIHPFTREEVQRLLEATKNDRLYALFVLAVTTGMRQGELFGLQWGDLDLEGRRIRIVRQVKDYRGTVVLKEPKTAAGIRTISITESACVALSARRVIAAAESHTSLQVFTSPRGMLIRRTLFAKRAWKPLLIKLGLTHRGGHHLRHTAATMMLAAGVPPHIVAGVLGHETAESVMKTYAHFITTDSRIASEAMARILG